MTTHAHRAHDRHEPEGDGMAEREQCGDRGPRIGEDGTICRREPGHPTPHRTAPSDGHGNVEWSVLPDSTPTEREAGDVGEVDRVARVLMTEWERVEREPVTASYVATFADMARAVIADHAERERAAGARALRLFRMAAELTVDAVRANRGDYIAGLVEDRFAEHFARAAALAPENAQDAQ